MDSPRQRISNIFPPAIVLLAYLLCAPSVAATNYLSLNSGEQLSSGVAQKDRGMRLADLPAKAREMISHHLARAEYDVSRCKKTLLSGKTSAYRAFNRDQNLSAYFTGEGVHLLPNGRGEPAWHLEMTLSGYGYDGAMEKVQRVRSHAIKVSGHRVEYRRGVLTEWYVNDERGLEQGVTFSEPPAGKGAGPLVVEWAVSGSLLPRLERQGGAITFGKTGSGDVLRYSGLKARDATGRPLPAKLALRIGGPNDPVYRIAYVVDDTKASYPVMIDPVFTKVKKVLAGGMPNDWFGRSVSISSDTAVVGADGDDDNGSQSGSAYIFYRNQGGANNWGQVKKITASYGPTGTCFGYSVSISGDTVVVGAYGAYVSGSSTGSVFVFDRDEGGGRQLG